MFQVDLGAAFDDMHQRHAVPAAQGIIRLEPVQDLAGLDVGIVETSRLRFFDDLARRLAGLGFDGIEIGLKGHVVLLWSLPM